MRSQLCWFFKEYGSGGHIGGSELGLSAPVGEAKDDEGVRPVRGWKHHADQLRKECEGGVVLVGGRYRAGEQDGAGNDWTDVVV